jgi:hypothetical protein
LDIFSGRPNPSWRLSDKKARELADRVENRAVASADSEIGSQVLGFRGLVVAATSDADGGGTMPATFRIGGAAPPDAQALDAGRSALTADEIEDTVRWLLATGAHVIGDDIAPAVHEDVESTLRGALDAEPFAEAIEEAERDLGESGAACIIANTAYNPGFWNTPAVQPKNNCYNYAMNFRSDTFAQPGRISGHPNGVMACAQVATAANWDGCKAVCSGSNKNVALVTWPGVDYHWYRRHSQGFWGHKPGGTAARNVDQANQVINGRTRTPANCNRGPYTIFCGYRFSPTGMKVR